MMWNPRAGVGVLPSMRGALVAMAACTATASPAPISNQRVAPVQVVAPSPPPPVVDLGKELARIGTQRRVELAPALADPGLVAFGACSRPGPTEQDQLRARLQAWVDARYPNENTRFEPISMTFGCLDRAGIVVDARMDTMRKGAMTSGPDVGHWWTVRIDATTITLLAEATGLSMAMMGEWAWSTIRNTLALADFDGDGVFDVISVLDSHEGGSPVHDLELSTIASGKTTALAQFGDSVELATQSFDAGHPVVVRIRDRVGTTYRCIDGGPLLLSTCPRLAAARRHDEAVEAADLLARGSHDELQRFDRDHVAELLSLLDIPEAERARLIATASPDPARVAARKIGRFAAALDHRDDFLSSERDRAHRARVEQFSTTLRGLLGIAECKRAKTTPAVVAKVKAWIAANDRSLLAAKPSYCAPRKCAWRAATGIASTTTCASGAKSYVVADWSVSSPSMQDVLARRALLFIDGERLTFVVDSTTLGSMDPTSPIYPPLEGGFYLRGDTAIAMLRAGDVEAMSVSDGKIRDRRAGAFSAYAFEGEEITTVIVDRGADGLGLWHAEPALRQVVKIPAANLGTPVPARRSALENLIFDHELRRLAVEHIGGINPSQLSDTLYRDATVRALEILKAPAPLIAQVREL